MKSIIKALLVVLSTVLVFTASMMGTAAYFTAGVSSQNIRFSVGQVSISLNTPYAVNHTIVPDTPIPIEPIVTLNQGSDAAYIRILVTLNQIDQLDAIYGTGEGTEKKLDLRTLLDSSDLTTPLDSSAEESDTKKWTYSVLKDDTTNKTRTYEFRYKEDVAASNALPAPFKTITLPGVPLSAAELTAEGKQNLFNNFTLTIEAQAVQSTGYDSLDTAWATYTP